MGDDKEITWVDVLLKPLYFSLPLFYVAASLAKFNTLDIHAVIPSDTLEIFSSELNAIYTMRVLVIVGVVFVSLMQAVVLRFFVGLVFRDINFTVKESYWYVMVSYVPWMVIVFLQSWGLLQFFSHTAYEALLFGVMHTVIYAGILYFVKNIRGARFVVFSLLITSFNAFFSVWSTT